MFQYNLNNKPNFNINTKLIDDILKIMSNSVSKTQFWTLNIVFVDDNSIQKLNKDYRQIDKVTDVLSFHYFDDFSALKPDDVAGEIILSENKIISQAKEYWLGEEKEFYKLLIHSILHILWYDHIEDNDYEIMQEKETLIWNEVFGK